MSKRRTFTQFFLTKNNSGKHISRENCLKTFTVHHIHQDWFWLVDTAESACSDASNFIGMLHKNLYKKVSIDGARKERVRWRKSKRGREKQILRNRDNRNTYLSSTEISAVCRQNVRVWEVGLHYFLFRITRALSTFPWLWCGSWSLRMLSIEKTWRSDMRNVMRKKRREPGLTLSQQEREREIYDSRAENWSTSPNFHSCLCLTNDPSFTFLSGRHELSQFRTQHIYVLLLQWHPRQPSRGKITMVAFKLRWADTQATSLACFCCVHMWVRQKRYICSSKAIDYDFLLLFCLNSKKASAWNTPSHARTLKPLYHQTPNVINSKMSLVLFLLCIMRKSFTLKASSGLFSVQIALYTGCSIPSGPLVRGMLLSAALISNRSVSWLPSIGHLTARNSHLSNKVKLSLAFQWRWERWDKVGVEERLQDGKERGQKTASSVPDHYCSSVVARVSHEARVIQVSIMSGAQRFLKFKLCLQAPLNLPN